MTWFVLAVPQPWCEELPPDIHDGVGEDLGGGPDQHHDLLAVPHHHPGVELVGQAGRRCSSGLVSLTAAQKDSTEQETLAVHHAEGRGQIIYLRKSGLIH